MYIRVLALEGSVTRAFERKLSLTLSTASSRRCLVGRRFEDEMSCRYKLRAYSLLAKAAFPDILLSVSPLAPAYCCCCISTSIQRPRLGLDHNPQFFFEILVFQLVLEAFWFSSPKLPKRNRQTVAKKNRKVTSADCRLQTACSCTPDLVFSPCCITAIQVH